MSDSLARRSVIAAPRPSPKGRKVKDVPFVELRGKRIQGVISSGSDVERVYCAFYEAGTGNFYCSTNNNRRCGGLGGGGCKHIVEMVGEAVKVFGADGLASGPGPRRLGHRQRPQPDGRRAGQRDEGARLRGVRALSERPALHRDALLQPTASPS
jgi:hypothetical protein